MDSLYSTDNDSLHEDSCEEDTSENDESVGIRKSVYFPRLGNMFMARKILIISLKNMKIIAELSSLKIKIIGQRN